MMNNYAVNLWLFKNQGQPNGDGNCLILLKGSLFDDYNCNYGLSSLCKTEARSEAFIKQYEATGCPLGWEYYENSCYRIYDFSMNYYKAQAYCPSQEPTSYLANITSDSEFSWIQVLSRTKSTKNVWVKIIISLNKTEKINIVNLFSDRGYIKFGIYFQMEPWWKFS